MPTCGIPDCQLPGCNRDYGYGEGYDVNGYDSDGYDRDGYDRYGYDRQGYASDGYNEDGNDRNGYDRCQNGDCDSWCDCQERRSDERLMNYTYRPPLKFNGERPPWYGMELEITTDNISSMLDVVESAAPRLIYAKEDSSVDGAELVTHPMSFPWAMEKFPWEMLTDIRATGASVIGEENGIHVHVGRDGFSNAAHLYRWMKFWYRNPRDIQRIARRRASHWAPFNPQHRKDQVKHVKRGKPDYAPWDDSTARDRYAAINATNDDTLEVRVFASTLRPRRAQAALQLVAGTVEYTRTLTAESVAKRHGWEWPAFISYAGKAGDYSALLAEDRTRRYL